MIGSGLLKRVRLIQTRRLAVLLISCSLLSLFWANTGIARDWIFRQISYNYTAWNWKYPSYLSENIGKRNVSNTTPTQMINGTFESGSVYERTGISCAAIFQGNKKETRRAEEYMKTTTRGAIWTAERYNQSTSNCTRFKLERGYITEPMSTEEAEYSIAYSILMYKDYEQTERLLRAIYHPQNFYCIHPDARAEKEVHETLKSIVRCFDNVFIAPKLWKVYWGHISMMYAERTCLEKLVNYTWFYSINLSGQMFPLRTNGEIVRILKLYNGSNDIEGRRAEALQFRSRYENKWRLSEADGNIEMTSEKKAPPPYNVSVYKGTNNAAISRAFALYFLYSNVSRELTDYFADTYIPDEFLWPTLNRNRDLETPGGYFGDLESYISNTRLTIWGEQSRGMPCNGMWVRTVCNFGINDLAWLDGRPEMFVNKFNRDYHWLAYDCMEERLVNMTLQYSNVSDKLNLTYYSNSPFVRS